MSDPVNESGTAGESGQAELAILFADIVGSTQLYEKLGDTQARELVAECLRVLSGCVTDNNGHVIKTIGDEVMCTFNTADDATSAAIDMQDQVMNQLPITNRNTPAGFRIRVGLHHGPAIIENADVFGDAVNVAARMSKVAKAAQVITTQATVAHLSPVLKRCTRHIDRLPVRGKSEEIDIFEVIWQPENMTMVGTAPVMPQTQYSKLRLTHEGQSVELESAESTNAFMLGRSSNADFTVDDTMISREHARIFARRGRFYVADQSTNGTYVDTAAGPVYLKREEIVLSGSGRISLGRELSEATHVVKFECE